MDGRPLNDPLSRHGGIKWSMVSITNIEKIEIFKGSGAVAFGDGTSGGAIRITSKKIGGSRAKLKAEGGNWNTHSTPGLRTPDRSFWGACLLGLFFDR
jgi:outer membrane receptor protein involved in Fe transport